MKSYIHKKNLSTTMPFYAPHWAPQRPGPFAINTAVIVHVLFHCFGLLANCYRRLTVPSFFVPLLLDGEWLTWSFISCGVKTRTQGKMGHSQDHPAGTTGSLSRAGIPSSVPGIIKK